MNTYAANVLGINPALALTVNGAAATLPAGFSSLGQLRQSSPLFQLNFGPNNPAGWPESVVPAIVDGYIVAMQPLAQGNCQIHVTTLTQGIGPTTGYNFAQDLTYNVSSVPEPATWASLALGLLAVGARSLRRCELERGCAPAEAGMSHPSPSTGRASRPSPAPLSPYQARAMPSG